jgi:hypothetical protein
MNKITRTLFILLLIALMAGSLSLQGQSTNNVPKFKSKIVHEEKLVKGVKSNYIESEEKCDQNGNVVEEIQYKDGKVDKHFVYEYDSENNKVKETELDSSGKPKKFSEYKYQKGLRTEKSTFDENKKLISKKTYSYTY